MTPVDDRPQLAVKHKAVLTLAIMLAVLMQVLDTTIANVALPYMEVSLGATHENISWVLTSYIVASAMAIPLSGWLAARIGARALLLLSIALFVTASMLCGVAQTLPVMVVARVAQGIGGAFLAPLGQTTMLDINRPSEHGKAMSYFGMGVMIGPILGPILGGWLTDQLGWRWVFYINLPIGLLAFAGIWLLLPRGQSQPRRMDLTGWALIATALASLQLMLDRGEHVGWFNANEIWIEAGLAASAFWMFAVHTMTARAPLFPPVILRDRNLMGSCTVTGVLHLVGMASMALLPTMLQSLFGYPVVTTGLVLAGRGLAVMVSMWVAGKFVQRVDVRLMIAAGTAITAVGAWEMTAWSLDMDWRPVFLNGVLQGIGLGLIFVPLSVIAFATLPARYRTEGASLYALFRSTGSSIGIAITVVMLTRNMQISHADLSMHLTPYNLPADPSLMTMAGGAGETALGVIDGLVSRQAAMIAYLDDFYLMYWVSVAVLPVVLILRKTRRGAEPVMVAPE